MTYEDACRTCLASKRVRDECIQFDVSSDERVSRRILRNAVREMDRGRAVHTRNVSTDVTVLTWKVTHTSVLLFDIYIKYNSDKR